MSFTLASSIYKSSASTDSLTSAVLETKTVSKTGKPALIDANTTSCS